MRPFRKVLVKKPLYEPMGPLQDTLAKASSPGPKAKYRLPKIRGTFLAVCVTRTKIISILGSILGSPFFGETAQSYMPPPPPPH